MFQRHRKQKTKMFCSRSLFKTCLSPGSDVCCTQTQGGTVPAVRGAHGSKMLWKPGLWNSWLGAREGLSCVPRFSGTEGTRSNVPKEQ